MTIDEIIRDEADKIVESTRNSCISKGLTFTEYEETLFRSGISYGLVLLGKAVAKSGIDVVTKNNI